jgi:hypothetical protein
LELGGGGSHTFDFGGRGGCGPSARARLLSGTILSNARSKPCLPIGKETCGLCAETNASLWSGMGSRLVEIEIPIGIFPVRHAMEENTLVRCGMGRHRGILKRRGVCLKQF